MIPAVHSVEVDSRRAFGFETDFVTLIGLGDATLLESVLPD